MAKSINQKAKLLYIIECLTLYTDEEHDVGTPRLIEYLEARDIKADRKTIYSDIEVLKDFGFDIIRNPGPRGGYFLASRDFELAEVKLLVDLVQSSKFITTKKSRELIKKLEKLASTYQANSLQRQVVVADRIKAGNENIYYNVDIIYEAIRKNVKIRFQYYEWGIDKKPVVRKGGEFYEVSPWLLNWDDENYYLLAFDEKNGIMKHYRVDKMLNIETTEVTRMGKEQFEKIDIAAFSKKTFGMFSGEEKTVQLLADKSLTGVLIDRFGVGVALRKFDEDRVLARANVAVSPQFFGWLCGLGKKIAVYGPDEVKEDYLHYLKSILNAYEL